MSNFITPEIRQFIIDDLIEIGQCSGQRKVAEFSEYVCPELKDKVYRSGKGMVNALDDISRHMDSFDDWDYEFLFYRIFEIRDISDKQFLSFCERYVHPTIKRTEINKETKKEEDLNLKCVEAIRLGLSDSGYTLIRDRNIAGRAVYKIKPLGYTQVSPVKNLIFAAKFKPDIVLGNAMRNEIQIKDPKGALIYDESIADKCLTWKELEEWYNNRNYNKNKTDCQSIKDKFYECLDSPAEKLFLDAYFELLEDVGENIPALLPQVYLYYDPKLMSQRDSKVFEHQKIDFMMIFDYGQCAVMEIDGQQHYGEPMKSDNNKYYASPLKYAEMMSAHRKMTLSGYDVYRFGGREFWCGGEQTKEDIIISIKDFFNRLLNKYRII